MNKLLALAGLGLFVSSPLQAADLAQGKALVEANCVRCHGSEVFTRPDRHITSLPGLHKQVQRCEQMLGLTWFDDEVNNVTDYLNHQYYKFDAKP